MYLNQRVFKAFVLLSVLVFVNACTRAEKEKSVTNFSIPMKMTKMLKGDSSTVKRLSYELNYIAINITGPNMAAVFCAYDLEHLTSRGPCKFGKPNSEGQVAVTIEVANGDSRLFQVVTANRDELNMGGMVFYYADNADKLTSLNGADTSVSLQLAELNNGSSQGTGHVAGRYITGGTVNNPVGPSGLLELKLKPKEGKPSVTIQQTEMYSGWFQAFGLEMTAFEYVINNQVLFGKAVKKSDFVAMSTATGSVAVSNSGSGNGDYDIVGFFVASTSLNSLLAGRVAVPTMNCSSVAGKTPYENCLSFQDRFQGPFKPADAYYGSMIGFSGAAPSPTTVSWAFLPGVVTADNSVIDGVTILQASQDLNPDVMEGLILQNGFNCDGYKKMAGIVATDIPASTVSKQFTAGLDPNVMEMRPLAICPRKGTTLYTSAITEPNFDSHSGDGGGGGPYLMVQLSNAMGGSDGYTVAQGGCYQLQVYSYEGQGIPKIPSTTMNLEISVDWGQLYSNYNCESASALGSTGNINIDSYYNYSMGSLYIKPTGTGAGKLFQVSGYSSSPDGYRYESQWNKANIVVPQISIEAPTSVVQNVCYEGQIRTSLPNGVSYPGEVKTLVVQVDNAQFGLYNTVGDCTANTNSITATSRSYDPNYGYGAGPFYFKKLNTGTHSIQGTDNDGILSAVNYSISTGSGTVTMNKIKITGPTTLDIGRCVMFKAEVVNASNIPVPASSSINFNLDPAPDMAYYNDGSCTSYEQTSFNIPQGQTSTNFFVKALYANAFANFIISGTNAFTVDIGPTKNLIIPTLAPDIAYLVVTNPPMLPIGKEYSIHTVLGSHNFPYTINFQIPTGSMVSCTEDGYSWGDCGGRLIGNSFQVQAMDLINPYYHKLRVQKSNGYQMEYKISEFFRDAQVITCDITMDLATVNFTTFNATVAANTNVCLTAGTLAKGAGSDSRIIITDYQNFIGHINFGNGLMDTMITPEASLPAIDFGTLTSTAKVTNVKFNLNSSGSSGLGFNSGTPVGYIDSLNNSFVSTGATNVTGINATTTTNFSVHSTGDKFSLNASAADVTAIKLEQGSGHSVRYSQFQLVSTASYLATGVSFLVPSTGSGSNLMIERTSFGGSGQFIHVEGDTTGSAYNFPEVSILKSQFVSNNVNNAAAYPIYMQDRFGFNFSENYLSNAATGVPAIKLFMLNSLGSPSGVMITKNRLVSSVSQPLVGIFSSGTYLSSATYRFQENHFVKTGGGVGGIAIQSYMNSGSGNVDIRNMDGTPGNGKNLFCATSSGDAWSNVYSGNTIYAASEQFAPPTALNTASGAPTWACTHTP